MTFKEQMLYWFIIIAETTFFIPFPVPLSQVILGENHSFLQVPQKNFNFKWNFYLPGNSQESCYLALGLYALILLRRLNYYSSSTQIDLLPPPDPPVLQLRPAWSTLWAYPLPKFFGKRYLRGCYTIIFAGWITTIPFPQSRATYLPSNRSD